MFCPCQESNHKCSVGSLATIPTALSQLPGNSNTNNFPLNFELCYSLKSFFFVLHSKELNSELHIKWRHISDNFLQVLRFMKFRADYRYLWESLVRMLCTIFHKQYVKHQGIISMVRQTKRTYSLHIFIHCIK